MAESRREERHVVTGYRSRANPLRRVNVAATASPFPHEFPRNSPMLAACKRFALASVLPFITRARPFAQSRTSDYKRTDEVRSDLLRISRLLSAICVTQIP
jgi:hypothetical protein